MYYRLREVIAPECAVGAFGLYRCDYSAFDSYVCRHLFETNNPLLLWPAFPYVPSLSPRAPLLGLDLLGLGFLKRKHILRR